MKVNPDDYLDARRPQWLDAEMIGRVRYDPLERVIVVIDPYIQHALRPKADIR